MRTDLSPHDNIPLLIPDTNGQMTLVLDDSDKQYGWVLLRKGFCFGDPPRIRRPTNSAGEPSFMELSFAQKNVGPDRITRR